MVKVHLNRAIKINTHGMQMINGKKKKSLQHHNVCLVSKHGAANTPCLILMNLQVDICLGEDLDRPISQE